MGSSKHNRLLFAISLVDSERLALATEESCSNGVISFSSASSLASSMRS